MAKKIENISKLVSPKLIVQVIIFFIILTCSIRHSTISKRYRKWITIGSICVVIGVAFFDLSIAILLTLMLLVLSKAKD